MAIAFRASAQGFSVFNLPVLGSIGISGLIFTKSYKQASKVWAIAAGGVFKAFKLRKSSILRPARAS